MKHIGLFEGQGGFSLAARWMGWDTVAWCEINPFCQTILKYHFPKATPHSDIKTTDFTIYANRIDVLTGGFPCQPYSLAGKRKGDEDDRHLWPEMLRAVREVRPPWVVGENVPGIINWGGGLVFEQVQADLETEGYEVQPFLLPASSVGAPHKRDRVWFVAHATLGVVTNPESGRPGGLSNQVEKTGAHQGNQLFGSSYRMEYDAANTERSGRIQNLNQYTSKQSKQSIPGWEGFPTQSPVCSGDDGLSCRLDAIAFSKWRSESIKSAGNAIVPQVVLQIFKAIELYGRQ